MIAYSLQRCHVFVFFLISNLHPSSFQTCSSQNSLTDMQKKYWAKIPSPLPGQKPLQMLQLWEQYQDPASGRFYYVNSVTKERSWKPPRRARHSDHIRNTVTSHPQLILCMYFVTTCANTLKIKPCFLRLNLFILLDTMTTRHVMAFPVFSLFHITCSCHLDFRPILHRLELPNVTPAACRFPFTTPEANLWAG